MKRFALSPLLAVACHAQTPVASSPAQEIDAAVKQQIACIELMNYVVATESAALIKMFGDPCEGKPREDVNCDGVINLSDALQVKARIPVTSQPTTQSTTSPAPNTPVACTVTVGPADNWQAIVDSAKPGDGVCFKGGDYKNPTGGSQLYDACLKISVSGLPGKPITIRNVPGEKPVFWGTYPLIWAIRIGYVKYSGEQTGVHDVIIDGLSATQGPWDGIEIAHSWNVVVRNCSAFGNNFNSPNGYKAGINIDAGHDITIDHCRVFDNGFGINAYEDQPNGAESATPDGPTNVTIANNFVFGNSRSGNLGNSSGLDIRFATHCNYVGNVFYDNPDAGINGEGNNFCRVLNNICINNWQPGGNNEGIKLCVRGGGCNVIAGNLSISNGNCGLDCASGVADLVVGNTFYGNGSWGILAEGRETMMFNNLVAGNSVRVTDNSYPEQSGAGWSLLSDWNIYGRGPLLSTVGDTLTTMPPHAGISSIVMPGVSLPRSDPRQINTPEILWGVSTIEEVRAKILAAYRPSAPLPGTSLTTIAASVNANIPAVRAALDAAIGAASLSPDFQMKQATYRWQQLKAQLTSYDLSGLPDNGVIGAVR